MDRAVRHKDIFSSANPKFTVLIENDTWDASDTECKVIRRELALPQTRISQFLVGA